MTQIREKVIKIVKESFKGFATQKSTKEKLRSLQKIGQLTELLRAKQLETIIQRACRASHPSIRGELSYLIGRSGRIDKAKILLLLSNDKNEYVHGQATKALERLIKGEREETEEVEVLTGEVTYLKMEKDLIEKYPGQFASFYREKLIAVEPDKIKLMEVTDKKIGHVPYYIRKIEKGLPRVRLPRSRKADSED